MWNKAVEFFRVEMVKIYINTGDPHSIPGKMDPCKQMHINGVLNVGVDHYKRVGIPNPRLRGLGCDRMHGILASCDICAWNLCFGCSEPTDEKGIFTGWTGLCMGCRGARRKLPIVPKDWQLFYLKDKQEESNGAAAAGSSKDCAIVLDDEPPPVPKKPPPPPQPEESQYERLKKIYPCLPPHWSVSADEQVRRPEIISLFDYRRGFRSRSSVADTQRVFELINQAKHATIAGDTPSAFLGLIKTPHFLVAEIFRLQNYSRLRMFLMALDEAKEMDKQRPVSERAEEMSGTYFHGTHDKSADNIFDKGLKMVLNTTSAFGLGFYLSRGISIPFYYAIAKAMRDHQAPVLLMGEALIGKRGITNPGDVAPAAGDDTGGCGGDHVHVVFENQHYYPEYAIKLKKGNEALWTKQLESVRRGGDGQMPPAPPVVVPVPPPPPPPVVVIPPPPPPPPVVVLPPPVVLPQQQPPPLQPPAKRMKSSSGAAAGGGSSSTYKPTPPTSDEDSSDSSDDNYRPGARIRRP